MSHPRCPRLFFLHSELGQDAGARCSVRAVPNVRFLTLTCHGDDTGASGRGVSFKLPGWLSSSRVGSSGSCESRFRQNTAREGMGAAKSQVGDARYWCSYQQHRGNAGTQVSSHKRAPPARATNPKTGGRLTQAPAGTMDRPPFLFNQVGIFKLCVVSGSVGQAQR